ncbi:hypothetical protein [Corynebacterium sp.]|uniref:hypothetical protein n=1 Tax=Corynebacterium sp. TaxID=1720 RepID=UPI0025BE1091|nr:hypothetical protein [Corynebacterium sp.]
MFQLRGKSVEQEPDWFKTLSERVDELTNQMDGLHAELRGLQRWNDSALALIRQLLVLVHPDQRPVNPPELREDLDQTTG